MKKSIISSKARAISTAATQAMALDITNKNGDIGSITMLPLDKLDIGNYQKELNIERIRRIVEKFDINRMRPIEVSYRDGKYWVFDGQHRANAYLVMGFSRIPCIIHYGLTYEDEAYLFARQQEEVGAVNANHKWNALVEAGDQETMAIVKLCKDWGFTVLGKNNKGNNIKCVKSLRDLYHEFGPAKLATILMCIKNAWNYMPKSTDVAIIGGIARMVRSYPAEQFDFNRLTKVLSDTTPKMILRDMEDKHHGVRGESRRAAFQITDLYNKSLCRTSKRRLNTEVLK